MKNAKVVTFREAFWTWARVAALSFGGPAGQIAVMHKILVDEKKWISDERFLHALNYCMLLPGPEAQQLATYIGWLLHRTAGGLVAGTLFVLPGFFSILALSVMYAQWHDLSFVQAIFFGLKPAVLAIVVEAVLRIGKRVLKNGAMITIAVLAFVAIFFLDMAFPLVVLAAGLIGLAGGKILPDRFLIIKGHAKSGDAGNVHEVALHSVQPTFSRNLYVCATFIVLWFAPIGVLWITLGWSSTYVQESLLFSKAAVVTFGGAYSVLAYIAQQAVERYGWLRPGEMLDGLGMAETTPGPLIQVVQFVGFMGAYRDPGPFSPLVGGIVGSLVTTWVTYVPCFFWIFLGAPYIERLRGARLLTAALSSITAAVVGVVLNLAVWFSLHTLFAEVTTSHRFGLRLLVPELQSVNVASLVIAVFACALTFYWKAGMLITLAASTSLGVICYFLVT